MNTLLEAKNINKSFQIETEVTQILKNIDLQIQASEFVAIMGKSGSGKSTLLSILAGLDNPDTGAVLLNGTDLTLLSEDQLAIKRQTEISFVFQSFHLIPSLTVSENIGFPLKISQKFDQILVDKLLEKVDLTSRANSFPYQLSGGEKQRTAIARALVTQPQILFADEPTGNLDHANAKSVLNLLMDLQIEFKSALVIVTHDDAIAKLAHRIIRIVDGQLV